MRISAKVDYAVRAAVELAAAQARTDKPLKAERIAEAQGIPATFLNNILILLRNGGLIESRRGPDGGHLLARPADHISIADVVRAVDGPLGAVGGRAPEDVEYPGASAALRDTWVALRASVRTVLEQVTLADVIAGELPDAVKPLLAAPEAWKRR